VSTAAVAVPDLIADQFITIEGAADGCGIIIGAGAHQYAARSVAERNGIRCVVAAYAPVSLPSENLVPPGSADISSDPITIRRLWDQTRRGWNDRALTRVNANRSRLGLDPIDDVLGHIFDSRVWLAADATLGPPPATSGLRVVQTGAWILSDSRPLDRELEAFVEQGDPPVYFGLGSMPAPEGTSARLIAAARAAGRRVILSRGWADLDMVDSAPDCILVGDVNQQALFPRIAAVVHHGGAGTTTTAARAGTPQVALPMFGDQFYWGHRLRELGIGSAVPFSESTADRLASALRDALDPSVGARAADVAKTIRGDGARIAARQLQALVNADSSVTVE
jgi:vancomycin aglycone glucosyltransferase